MLLLNKTSAGLRHVLGYWPANLFVLLKPDWAVRAVLGLPEQAHPVLLAVLEGAFVLEPAAGLEHPKTVRHTVLKLALIDESARFG